MIRRLLTIVLFAITLTLPAVPLSSVAAEDNISAIVISALQTGGMDESVEDGRLEFIELHNQTAELIEITGWKLQYFSASREDVADGSAVPTRELDEFSGLIDSYGYILLSSEGYVEDADLYFEDISTASSGLLAKSGGHVRIIDTDNNIVDIVGWGTAKSPQTKAVPEIMPGFSAVRTTTADNEDVLADTNNNYVDFIVTDDFPPRGGSLIEIDQPLVPPCDGLVVSELLPNPEGIDTDHEFIELHNPTSNSVALDDCILSTSADGRQYVFPAGSVINPNEYQAFFDFNTGLKLPNAAGGEVILFGSTTEYSVEYPEDLDDNHAWAMVDGEWYDSDRATPNMPNVLPSPKVSATVDEEIVLELCPAGKFRNPETNRCKNIQAIAATLAPCAIGQVRNPETNRCRNITEFVSSLVPCRSGQERNPETNRCRNVLGASTAQAACQEGYERNPETNRCRKKAAASSVSPSVGSVSKDVGAAPLNFIFMAAATTAVLGYGVYEYRRDLSSVLIRIKAWSDRRSIK